MTKEKYFKSVKRFYYLMALYCIIGFISSIFLVFSLIKLSNASVVITSVYGFFILLSFILFGICIKKNRYKYNYADEKFYYKVSYKMRNAFIYIYLNLFYNLFIFLGFLYYGILNIIDYPFWLHNIILVGTLILFCIFSFSFVKKAWQI